MKNYLLIAVAFLAVAISSCKKDNSSSSDSTHLSVRLTDAPGSYDAVILNIKSVVVITSAGQSTLNVAGGPIDILHFKLGKDTLLASQDIPAGTLQQVRLVLNDTGNQVITGGATYDLTTPSGQTSGVKLNVHDTLKAGIGYTLKLDFDAASSIVQTGNGKFILKPVIRAIPNAVTGALTGLVTPAASSPKVFAIMGTDTLGTTTDSTGKFFFPGIAAGVYKVNFVPDSPYVAKTVTGITVTNGSTTDMGTVTISK